MIWRGKAQGLKDHAAEGAGGAEVGDDALAQAGGLGRGIQAKVISRSADEVGKQQNLNFERTGIFPRIVYWGSFNMEMMAAGFMRSRLPGEVKGNCKTAK